ncbi:MAG: AAA family ATPase [Lentisphaeria bacterium]|nr:AAA family ATPase [Lentisphaeria bacterium]
MIERKITPYLLEMARYFPVVTIMGPRQSGKTTLARTIFPNHVYVNLEDKAAREIALSDPKTFFFSVQSSGYCRRDSTGPGLAEYHSSPCR